MVRSGPPQAARTEPTEYDPAGQQVATLVGEPRQTGACTVTPPPCLTAV